MKSLAEMARKTVSKNNVLITKAGKAVSQVEKRSENLIIFGVEEDEELEADLELSELLNQSATSLLMTV